MGEKYKIAYRNCHMPESVWLFDIRFESRRPYSKRDCDRFELDDPQR